MIKLVKESLYEAFSEGGDPIEDMGIGVLSKYKDILDSTYKFWNYVETKDTNRIKDIIKKAQGDAEKENKLARTMCKLIGDRHKAYRRYVAARQVGGENWEVTKIFLLRAAELSNILV